MELSQDAEDKKRQKKPMLGSSGLCYANMPWTDSLDQDKMLEVIKESNKEYLSYIYNQSLLYMRLLDIDWPLIKRVESQLLALGS